MSNLSNFSEKIATKEFSAEAVVEACRIIGIFGSPNGIEPVLKIATFLEPSFVRLTSLFPEARPLLNVFTHAKDIKALIEAESSAVQIVSGKSCKNLSHYCGALVESGLSPTDLSGFQNIADFFAFCWVVHSSWHLSPGNVPSTACQEILEVWLKVMRALFASIEDEEPYLKTVAGVVQIDSEAEWRDKCADLLHAAAQALSYVVISSPSLDQIKLGISDAIAFVRKAHNKIGCSIPASGFIDSRNAPDASSFYSDQCGIRLSERERLPSHHNSFTSDEIKFVDKAIHGTLKEGDSRSPYYFEAIIAGLALSTGRTVSAALGLPLISESSKFPLPVLDSTDHIRLELLPGYKGSLRYFAYWQRILPNSSSIKLPLPSFFTVLKEPPFRIMDGGTVAIKDCLPYSSIPWEDRCLTWLESICNTSRQRLTLAIRDSLSRAIYQSSSNTALLSWLCSPNDGPKQGNTSLTHYLHPNDGPKQGNTSLTHYLHPNGDMLLEAYERACRRIFRFGSDKDARQYASSASRNLAQSAPHSKSEYLAVATYFRKQLSEALNTGDYISFHNAFAYYVLMVLVVATGHRKSTAPFFFPWDVQVDEGTAYLCDKLSMGSEARFVPIPSWVSSLFSEYLMHLRSLGRKVEARHPQIALEIKSMFSSCVSIRPSGSIGFEKKTHADQAFGVFFQISEDGRCKTVSTFDLEQAYANNASVTVGDFRKCIAQVLWERGASGMQIEAFLGHNEEMHVFGPSSTWSIEGWAKCIRPAQEAYLNAMGWAPVGELGVNINRQGWLFNPNPIPSGHSYESRKQVHDDSLVRARQTIREMLPPEWFRLETSYISDEDVRVLKEEVLERLSGDQLAANKVYQSLRAELSRIRKATGVTIASALINLARTEPGAVAVGAARNYAIAVVFRRWWISQQGYYQQDNQYLGRLAHIGISLIVFDAVLDERTWKCCVEAIINRNFSEVRGCIRIEVRVERTSRAYSKEILLSPNTAAQVIGLHHKFPALIELSLEQVIKQSEKVLRASPVRKSSITISNLIAIFRVWWQLRLPGTLYSIASGQHSGPAADTVSASTLYQLPAADYVTVSSPAINSINPPMRTKSATDAKLAQRLLNKLLSEAERKFELKKQTKRVQRKSLAHLLSDPREYAALKAIGQEQTIVQIMLDYLRRLLEQGGLRSDRLAFSTIRTYFSPISNLVEDWWDVELDSFSSEDFDLAYDKIIESSDQDRYPVWLFHKFLMEEYQSPYAPRAMSYRRVAIECRSALLLPAKFKDAWGKSLTSTMDSQLQHHVLSYLGIGYQYGLRPREILGLSCGDLLGHKSYSIQVKPNNVRDLKTRHSRRIVPLLLHDKTAQKFIEGMENQCAHSPVNDESLFADQENKNVLYSKSRILRSVTSFMRAAAGNEAIVPHALRHTVGTRLAHAVIPSPRTIPISKFVEESLDSGPVDGIFSTFDKGFDAWPFWMDRVGMHMGHAGIDSLANTYWHTSSIRISEHTWHAAQDIQLTDEQLASMLGRQRSTISAQAARLAESRRRDLKRIDHESLIVHYTSKSKIRPINSGFEPGISLDAGILNDDISKSNRWIVYDRLLRYRLTDDLTFEQLRDIATQFNLKQSEVQRFIDEYINLVRKTAMDDFEPTNSDLVTSHSGRNLGPGRGSEERERGIATAQRLCDEGDGFLEKLQKFTELWGGLVNADDPYFVARSADECSLILDVLLNLGVDESQLEISLCDFERSRLKKIIPINALKDATERNERFSVGSRRIRESEVGIRIMQRKNAKIGDFRDSHRLALLLSALVRSQFRP